MRTGVEAKPPAHIGSLANNVYCAGRNGVASPYRIDRLPAHGRSV